MGRKAKPFNDLQSRQGLGIMEKLKIFCSETDCCSCVFADDTDGRCYFTLGYTPDKYNKKEVLELATSSIIN